MRNRLLALYRAPDFQAVALKVYRVIDVDCFTICRGGRVYFTDEPIRRGKKIYAFDKFRLEHRL